MPTPTNIAVIRNASYGINNARGYLVYWSYAKDIYQIDHIKYGYVDSWKTYSSIKKAYEYARSKNPKCIVLREKNDQLTVLED
jgi:hypothetical protein